MSNDVGMPSSVVQSVDRALAVMEILGREGWAGVTNIALELGIHKSTVFRLLSTLERRGMVEQHPETHKYRLGFALVRLASGVRSAIDLTRSARPVCERLSARTGETVNLSVLEGGEVVHIEQVNLSSSALSVDWLGRRTPLHNTSNGKVFLAHLPEQALKEILEQELPRTTAHTVVDPRALRAQLQAIREQGYGCSFEELEVGLNAVAAPVRGADGLILATVCVSGPSHRLNRERMPEVGQMTREAANEISHRLGFLGTPSRARPVRD
jgi:IclR family transcriptional regulator, acetate operon repressor